jgi:hypothetical protein
VWVSKFQFETAAAEILLSLQDIKKVRRRAPPGGLILPNINLFFFYGCPIRNLHY